MTELENLGLGLLELGLEIREVGLAWGRGRLGGFQPGDFPVFGCGLRFLGGDESGDLLLGLGHKVLERAIFLSQPFQLAFLLRGLLLEARIQALHSSRSAFLRAFLGLQIIDLVVFGS